MEINSKFGQFNQATLCYHPPTLKSLLFFLSFYTEGVLMNIY